MNDYVKTVWQDLPDTSTPITADRLNNIEDGIEYLFEHGVGGGDTLPIGIILPFSDDTIPEGYMLCDGSAISRTTYSTLFGIIGTTYGVGDGSTTFNLPNLKGKVPVGQDISDTYFDVLGETGGSKNHRHYNGMYEYNAKLSVSNVNAGSSHAAEELYNVNGTSGFTSVGSQNAYAYSTENGSSLQPYIVLNYIIKVSQTTSTQAQVVDGYSTSTTDSYSCNYANNMNTYSTNEIRIGTWINNKPIYRKVYKITDNPPSTSYNLNISNLDVVTKCEFIADYQLNEYRYRRGNTYLSNSDYINTFIRDNSIQIRIGETYSNITNLYGIYFIIEYTKTTD